MSNTEFPKFIAKVVSYVSEQGFDLYLVGGTARKIYLDSKLDKDLDFEVRAKEKKIEDWRELKNNFRHKFKYKYKNTHFDVVKFSHEGWSVEFAPARTESYEDKEYYGHSDFTVNFDLQLASKEAFARRDLTLNAFAFKITEDGKIGELVDPFGGVKDLEAKIARPITGDFHKDPVRVVRSIRFINSLGLEPSGALKLEWEKADCRKLSSYYFWYEAGKNPNLIPYMLKVQKVQNEFKINLPFHLAEMFSNPLEEFADICIESKNDLLCLLIKNNQKANLGKYAKCFQVSYKELEGLKNFWRYWNSWNSENKLHQFSMTIRQFDKFHEVLDYLNPWVSFVTQVGKIGRWKSSLKACFDEEEVYALELIERWQQKHKQFNMAPKLVQNISPKNRDKYKWFYALKK